ncbi:MAG: hypothetical protein DI536_31245 [Archangium gephyra]|uniref:TonB C-terminal domain-containing protein n=1 Tax=Archangium gephyra TaxID=48 RepID=A0A2W5SRR6_9BACT|nr:MAG: hypothetical protein DI536_31245 [Archangium gephyra]
MNLVEMLHEGGLGAYAALALGLLGALLGFAAIALSISRSKAGFGLGIATLIVADLTAMAGLMGTLWGRSQVQAALAFVDSKVDAERILAGGWAEAANAALIGFFAALLPLMLGGAAAVMGARPAASTTLRMHGEPQLTTDDSKVPRLMLVAIVEGITLISLGAAWVFAHQSPPAGKYNFLRDDQTAWNLASSIEAVNRDPSRGCPQLEEDLQRHWGATDKNEWPRVMQLPIPPPLLDEAKAAARTCVEDRLERHDDVAGLLTSPLLQDDALRARVRTDGAIPSLPPEAAGGDALDKASIAKVVRSARDVIRNCYERELVREPKLAGKVEIEFTISGRGDVSDANATEATTMTNAKVVSCVREAIETLHFPAPEDGQPVTVKYPFVLNPAP